LEEILKRIQPFSGPRKTGSYSTDGKWKISSNTVGVVPAGFLRVTKKAEPGKAE
jgi:hypothetical protein